MAAVPTARTVADTLRIVVESVDDRRVVRLAGELDHATSALAAFHCLDDDATHDVIVDLADLTFLDCGGYRAFDTARLALGEHRHTLTLVGAVGEPRRLLDLISQIAPAAG